MRYYEIKAEAREDRQQESVDELNERAMQEGLRFSDRRAAREITSEIKRASGKYNEKFDGKAAICVAEIRNQKVTMCAVTTENELRKSEALGLLKAIDIPVDPASLSMEEILMTDLSDLLQQASRADYIDDDDEVLDQFGLLRLYRNGLRQNEFSENLIAEEKEEEIYKKAEEYLSEETFLPELSRIFEPSKKKKIKGHPVHYFVETDNREIRKGISRALLSALHLSGRVGNRRYAFTDLDPEEGISGNYLSDLYKSAVGGSLIIRLTPQGESAESNYASKAQEALETVCEKLTEYRNEVLTIICMPRECERLKSILYENLGMTGIIEIKEDLADRTKAEKYLRTLSRKNGIRADKNLFSELEEGKTWLSPELQEIFSTWYDTKLKNTYYPQYKEVAASRRKAAKAEKKGDAYRELSEMVGLSEAKDVINKAIDYYKAQKLFASMGLKEDHPAMHMVFTGNPGSAKTTAARLFADILRDNGILSKGTLVEVGRSDLVGKYVGWTAPTVKKCFERAKGGVLFIDEAYSLVDDRDGMYGDEAINTIVQEMENHRDDLVVIFAGYPDKMEAFLEKNPGLRSRIAFHVPFNDYTTEELCEIAAHMGKKKGIRFTDDAVEKLSDLFREARKNPDFGNGRYVRNVLEKSRMNQASRLLKKNVDEITREDLSVIEAVDIEMPALSERHEEKIIGFAC